MSVCVGHMCVACVLLLLCMHVVSVSVVCVSECVSLCMDNLEMVIIQLMCSF